MKTELNKAAAKVVKGIIEQYTTREFPGFVAWLKEQWEANAPALLADNPPNHSYDVADGTMDLSIGQTSVKQKRAHHKHLKRGIFAYQIRCDDDFRTVVRSVPELSEDAQQEAAMAFLLEYRKGSYLCNTQEWRDIEVIVGKSEGLDNPFYKDVCQATLKVFQGQGWID
jgi:hypothetical protein